MPAINKNSTESEPYISTNIKSSLLNTLDAIFTPFSLSRHFLRQKNYKAYPGKSIRIIRPIIYFAEAGKIDL